MTSLLDKTRSLNRLLQQAAGQAVNFMEMAEVLKDTIQANVYVISRKGKILGFSLAEHPIKKDTHDRILEQRRIPDEANEQLKQILETTTIHDPNSPYQLIVQRHTDLFGHSLLAVVPVIGGGERIGTLVLARQAGDFVDDDLILVEYGSTIVGMEILRERAEGLQIETRNRTAVQVAVGSLSYSETEAVEHIFEELDNKDEGLLVASKIADRVGITRSVIVNALRKLESAGVIETRSLGMKGTYIKILNHLLFQEFSHNRV